jgi:S-adenosylmethionine:tRNA ribosyltransferase-isomerase
VNVADFDFHLPDSQIAQEPAVERGASRLLVLHRDTGRITHTTFAAIGDFLIAGDLLVLNDTRVFPARLLGHRVPSGGAVECLLVRELVESTGDRPRSTGDDAPAAGQPPAGQQWEALMHPGQKLKPGARVLFERDGWRLHGEVIDRHFFGRRTIRLWVDDPQTTVASVIDRIGHIPLPPYIKRDDRPSDRERYQTVYARTRGSIAAPTAGLHFTDALLRELQAHGVERAAVTLHVGYGTFKPVRVEQVEDHRVDPEPFSVSPEAAAALTRARRQRRRVIAVGTTTVRALESLPVDGDEIAPTDSEARLFIHPGHRFRVIDAMITNFHLPKSSLLMLVAAFAGREQILAAYRDAVAHGYRFYSYGDAMLIV